MNLTIGLVLLIVVVVFIITSAVKILMEYERGVIFRLGRFSRTGGPGLTLIIPFIEQLRRVDLRLVTMDVPPQDVITRDNVSVKVNAVLYFRVLGQAQLDELLSAREKINEELQTILDRQTDPWGIKVTNVEVKHVDLPQEMQRVMARQAEAERERRAKVINAEGEFQAATRLAEAAEIIAVHPQALQLRFLQTLTEVASENNSTILFPIPIDLLTPFLRGNQSAMGDGGGDGGTQG
jgi:regulator of protease activity HflC (stomatin/prohibitin superfamily)